MTLEQLAALKPGTRVKFDLCPDPGCDYGTISEKVAGHVTITWEATGSTSFIDTKSSAWERFAADLEVDFNSVAKQIAEELANEGNVLDPTPR